jgi:hypothetical protein
MCLAAVPACDSASVLDGIAEDGRAALEGCEPAFRRLHETQRAFERAVAKRGAGRNVDLPAGGTR